MPLLPTPMADALDADVSLPFFALKFTGAGVTLRLLDGSGEIAIGAETYTGEDATYGSLRLSGELVDGLTGSSPRLTFDILPPDDDAAGDLMEAADETSSAILYFGVLDRAAGTILGSPVRLFTGLIDVPSLVIGHGQADVTFEAVTAWERMQDGAEGMALTDASHQLIRTGEKFFEFVAEDGAEWWGQATPAAKSATPAKGLVSGTIGNLVAASNGARR